jgi:hypothetical protein
MLERDIEAYLVKRCKEIGALCVKFTSPQRRSVPDRLIVHKGRVVFVELKATGAKPTEAQVREHDRIEECGGAVVWTDSTSGVGWLIRFLDNGSCPTDFTTEARKMLDGPDDKGNQP